MVIWLHTLCTLAIGLLGLSLLLTQNALKQVSVLKSYLGTGTSSLARRRHPYPDDPDLDEYGDNIHPMNTRYTMGIMATVTPEQYLKTAQEALQDIEPLWRSVDTTCTLQVTREGVPKSKSERKKRRTKKDSIITMTERLDEFTFAFSDLPADNADAKMRLCRVNRQGD